MTHDPLAEAAAAVDYSSYTLRPDGSLLAQTTAPEAIWRMCRLLDVQPGMRVLEVGTGSGYSGALLGRLPDPPAG